MPVRASADVGTRRRVVWDVGDNVDADVFGRARCQRLYECRLYDVSTGRRVVRGFGVVVARWVSVMLMVV